MLSSLVKDHQAKQAIKKEELGKYTNNIESAMNRLRFVGCKEKTTIKIPC